MDGFRHYGCLAYGVVYVLELLHLPMSMIVIAATIATVILCLVLKLKYALGAMVGLIHDVLVPLGLFLCSIKRWT